MHTLPHTDSEDVIIFSNTISFDAHVLQMFPPLTVGACLVIAKPKGHLDPAYILELMLKYQVTGFAFTVPTLVRRVTLLLMREEQLLIPSLLGHVL